MGFRRVPELSDLRMRLQELPDNRALDTPSTAVNQPHLAESGFPGRDQILIHDRRNVGRGKSMQVQGLFNRDFDRVFGLVRTGHGVFS